MLSIITNQQTKKLTERHKETLGCVGNFYYLVWGCGTIPMCVCSNLSNDRN